MPVAIGGTFCIAHSHLLQSALSAHGIDCISDHPSLNDPFALLLHRIQHPNSLMITTKQDTVVHPEITRLLSDLASLLLPEVHIVMHVDLDEHELFYHLISGGYSGTFYDMSRLQRKPLYAIDSNQKEYRTTPFSHMTPVSLESIVQHILNKSGIISSYKAV